VLSYGLHELENDGTRDFRWSRRFFGFEVDPVFVEGVWGREKRRIPNEDTNHSGDFRRDRLNKRPYWAAAGGCARSRSQASK